MEERQPRKLAVILHADVVGSTTLVQKNESLAHARIQDAFRRFSSTIEAYNGVTHELRGDALVAEFARASDAVAAGLAFQIENTESNARIEDDLQPRLRIGISLGEVVIADSTVTGAGVVLAQRVEQLTEPGGVCITGAIHEAVPQHLPLDYSDLGKREAKGFEEPVQVYSASVKAGKQVPPPEPAVSVGARSRKPKHLWTAGAIALIVLVVGGLAWWQPWMPRVEPASIERMAFSLPDKPSIAVLPFENLSNDSEQEYFVDGMTDDLITDLSKLSGLTVIARNSVFSFKGMPRDLKKISNDLGVQYVLEGSVRRAGGMIRINAQLIDTTTAEHVWAERYDAEGTDIFAMQDKVVRNIVAALEVNLSDNEEIQLARIPTKNIEAYDFYLRGRRGLWVGTAQGRREALMNFQKAIELDRQFADAYAGVARVASMVWRMNDATVLPSPIARKLAYQASGKALSMDPLNAQAYSVLAHLQLADGNHEEAVRSVKKAISLQPGTAEIYTDLTEILVYAGRPEEALAAIETAFRLEPDPPPNFYFNQGLALFSDRRYQEAIEPLEKAFEEGVQKFEPLAKTYAQLGQLEKAKFMVDKLFEVFPGASLVEYRANESKLYRRQEDLDHSIDSLRKAGVPEWPFGYAAQPEDRLVGTAISELVLGQVWTGNDIVNGGPFIQETSEDGKTAFRSGYSLVTGKAWVENDQLCLHFPTYGEHHKICSYLFRNTDSAPGQQNDYVLVGETQVLHFSATPLDRAVGN